MDVVFFAQLREIAMCTFSGSQIVEIVHCLQILGVYSCFLLEAIAIN